MLGWVYDSNTPGGLYASTLRRALTIDEERCYGTSCKHHVVESARGALSVRTQLLTAASAYGIVAIDRSSEPYNRSVPTGILTLGPIVQLYHDMAPII